ncbi:MAG TPA: nicotinamide-nucleotide amidohydrolase family protein, partial [Steroidobacteraceae bacterium]|nr:nicotinamide-nucleotide amidohydrolase family protein [Steroidobacteraceae bacterium]
MPHTDRDLARLAARVGRHLSNGARCVATAESCTGGWIAKALTDIAGSSQWFTEGFVAYSNEAKVARLGVPASILRNSGAVSEAAVRLMAEGA